MPWLWPGRQVVLEDHLNPKALFRPPVPALAFLGAIVLAACGPDDSRPIPSPRAHHQLVFHAGTNRTYLIGGSTRRDGEYHYFSDVWTWNGARWAPTRSLPFPRSSHRVVYDRGRDALIMFGGGFGSAIRAEGVIWMERDGRWTALDGDTRAGANEPGVCYDPVRGRVVIFGGWNDESALQGDTWEWTGEDLVRVDSSGPAPRAGHGFAYDPVRRGCLLFGGRGDDGFLADTWMWNGAAWERLHVAGPSPRWFFGATTDPPNQRIVVFGGASPHATSIGRDGTGDLGDTWAWDGESWRRLAAAGPSPRSMAKLASTDRGILLFGGRIERPEGFIDRNDTWELVGDAWQRRR